MTGPDDLRAGLERAARAVDVDDLDLDAVRTTARRRRLRVRVGAGVGAAALLVGATVAVVAFNADDEPDTLATTDVDEQSEAAPTTVDDTPPSTPPSTEQSTAPALTVQTVERAPSVGQAVGVGGAPEYGEWSVPWQDGFLIGATSFEPQRLPDELPEEIIALFPQEVLDVFGGELPATISEATQMLSDAGLLETVTEIIAANPAASEAIYSVESEPTPPTLDTRFTTDGVTWESVEMTLPPDATYLSSVTAVDGRLVATYQVQAPTIDAPPDGSIRVAWTQNLVDWTVQEIAVPPPPVELPNGAYWAVYTNGLTANDAGWVASVYAGVELDPFALLPAEVRAEYEQSSDGYSSSFDDVGVSLERQVGDEWVTERYTWEELGVAADVVSFLVGQFPEPAMWAATWDGVPAMSSGPGPTQQIVGTSAGFVALDERIWFSADGTTWTATALPVENGYVSSTLAFDGGVIAFVGTPDGVRPLRLDERGGSPEWIDIPDLPQYVQGGFGFGSRLGILMDLAEPGPPPPPLVVESDGHQLTIDNVTGTVEVLDLDTGDVVASGDVPRSLDDDGPISFGDDGVTVTDVTTGTVVVVFPADELEAASRALFDTDASSEQEYLPDMWLLATTDGETFVLDDLDDGDGDTPLGFGTLAANGSRLLLQSGGNWVLYDLA